jgi:putative membrane protein
MVPAAVCRNDYHVRRGQSAKIGIAVTRFPNMASKEPHSDPVDSDSGADRISVELSSRRTGMSFQRTRMSADRTLMSVIRTALSLISFGFTIFQIFNKLHDAQILKNSNSARNFGESLVYLGIGMLVVGIGYHLAFMYTLRRERNNLKESGLVHGDSPFPASLTLLVAIVLLVIGVAAVIAMVTGTGPLR